MRKTWVSNEIVDHNSGKIIWPIVRILFWASVTSNRDDDNDDDIIVDKMVASDGTVYM